MSMPHGSGSAAALSQPFRSRALLLLHARVRHWDTGGGGSGNWDRIRVPGGLISRGSLAVDPLPPRVRGTTARNRLQGPLLPARSPPLLPPLHRRGAGGLLRRRRRLQLACSLADRGGGFMETCAGGGGAAGMMGAATVIGVLRDAGAAGFSLAGAYGLVLAFDNLAKRRVVEQALSRKLVHVLSGVLFLLTWPLFSSSPEARFFAAVVPLLNLLRLLVYGLGLVKDESLIKSVTRQGRREELLRGPLYYVVTLLVAVLVFWRDSPVGLVALCMMSGGDGFADIVGRRLGTAKLPFNSRKSWAGSASMFVFGYAISLGMLYYFWALGFLPALDWDGGGVALKVAFIALAATAVESLPLPDTIDDNVSVPLASIVAAMAAFGP